MKNSGIPWIGEIPEKWSLVQGKRLFISRKRIVGDEVEKYERLALTMNGVIKRNKDDNEGLQPEQFEGYQILRKNELVFKLIDLQNVKTSRVGLSPYEGIVSPAYITLQNASKDNRFYYYWYMFLYHYQVYNKLAGDGVRSALNVDDLLQIPIPEIPLSEQQAIADFLDKKCAEIDQMVALQEKFIEELKAYKQSLITETVTKGLNPNAPMKDSGVEWIGEIPEGWKDISLRQLFVIKAGGDAKPELYSDVCDVEHPYPVYTNTLDAKQVYAYTSMPLYCANSITVTGRGAVGHAIYREEPYDAIIRLLSLSPKMDVDCRYYAYYIDNVLHIFTNNAAIAQLSAEQLAPYHVLLPSKSEQQAIADYLDKKCAEIDQLIAIKQKKADELKEYKKSIIYEYVTGKRSVCE